MADDSVATDVFGAANGWPSCVTSGDSLKLHQIFPSRYSLVLLTRLVTIKLQKRQCGFSPKFSNPEEVQHSFLIPNQKISSSQISASIRLIIFEGSLR